MTFPCTKCGACCRRVDAVADLADLDRGDGACVHLAGDNTCRIYEERPKACRVDDNAPAHVTPAAWYRVNEEACAVLRLHVYGQEAHA